MKICTSEQEFIDYVAPFAQKVCKRFGFYCPSVLVAQACKEVGYAIPGYWDNPGVRGLVEENNMVGIKRELLNKSWVDIGLSVWPGKYLNKLTPEVYGGVPVTVPDDFRIYDNVEQSFADYLCFMRWGGYSVSNPKYYNKIKGVKNPAELISIVHNLGYATGPTYASGVLKIVSKHNLTRFDNLDGVIPSEYYPAKGKEETQVNSTLVSHTHISPSNSGQRTHSIDRITPHCVVGQMSIEDMLNWLAQPSTKASANYGIGADGRIGLGVPENVRAWTSSSSANDNRSVTVECASDKTHPYAFNAKVYDALVRLCTDIGKRNGKTKLLWLGDDDDDYRDDQEATLAYQPAPDEMVLTAHRWFAAKACPGDWMYKRMGDLAKKVTAALGGSSEPSGTDPTEGAKKLYRVQVGAYQKRENAEKKLRQISATGTDCFITELQDGFYRVQCGAYSIKANAEAKKNALNYMGFDAIIKEYDVA